MEIFRFAETLTPPSVYVAFKTAAPMVCETNSFAASVPVPEERLHTGETGFEVSSLYFTIALTRPRSYFSPVSALSEYLLSVIAVTASGLSVMGVSRPSDGKEALLWAGLASSSAVM
ncbi:MAG: hypothetical protein BWY32_03848 [bacterium ADurb.Bin243]|nr:MAG: hypothetical protein BWY32_03848 [bacterium ADurb.Bin243]